MSLVRVISSLFLSVFMLSTFSACSLFSSSSTDEDAYSGEENIPLSSAGKELRDVNFAYDSSSLSSEARSTLEANAQWLTRRSNKKVVVEGHCDERGTAEYNLALGERRARSVSDYLRSLGVSRNQMSTISYGEELPLDPRSNEAAYAKNRRAHFSLK